MGVPNPIAGVFESGTIINLSIKKATLRYLDSFIRLKCAPDLLLFNVFPNAKEITESMAVYEAAAKFVGRQKLKEDIQCLVVGDGSTPRTATLVAMRSKWQVISIDPSLREKGWHRSVRRLILIPKKLGQAIDENLISFDKPTLILAVHNHAPKKEIDQLLEIGKKSIIGYIDIPCCVQDNHPDSKPLLTYADYGIHSQHRTIRIWKFADVGSPIWEVK